MLARKTCEKGNRQQQQQQQQHRKWKKKEGNGTTKRKCENSTSVAECCHSRKTAWKINCSVILRNVLSQRRLCALLSLVRLRRHFHFSFSLSDALAKCIAFRFACSNVECCILGDILYSLLFYFFKNKVEFEMAFIHSIFEHFLLFLKPNSVFFCVFCLFVVIVCAFFSFVCFTFSLIVSFWPHSLHLLICLEYTQGKKSEQAQEFCPTNQNSHHSFTFCRNIYLFLLVFFSRSNISESRLAGSSKYAEKMACYRFEKPATTAFERCFNNVASNAMCTHLHCVTSSMQITNDLRNSIVN